MGPNRAQRGATDYPAHLFRGDADIFCGAVGSAEIPSYPAAVGSDRNTGCASATTAGESANQDHGAEADRAAQAQSETASYVCATKSVSAADKTIGREGAGTDQGNGV